MRRTFRKSIAPLLAVLALSGPARSAPPDRHDLSGTVRLFTPRRSVYPAGQCPVPALSDAEQAEKARNPNWNPGQPRGKRVDPGSACNGRDVGKEAARIAAGVDVTVRNEKGEVVGVGKTTTGAWHSWHRIWGECRMTFLIPAVPAAQSYDISIAGMRPVKRSYQEVQDRNWTVELTVP
jgi:hypothetical protein